MTQTRIQGSMLANLLISQVTGLQTALDGKSGTSHTHTSAQITDLNGLINIRYFTSSGTYVKTAGTRKIIVIGVGGGGGGGGRIIGCQTFQAAGGGAGGCFIRFLDVSSLDNIVYTIGAGGAAVGDNGTGGTGGTTTFGTGGSIYGTATGGTGGNNVGAGGAGGTASSGTANFTGGRASVGGWSNSGLSAGLRNAGAASFFGGDGAPGSGGQSAPIANVGNSIAGAAGAILIFEFAN